MTRHIWIVKEKKKFNMSFLTSYPDLSGTIYCEQDLQAIRKYLVTVIKEIDPGWLDSPEGHLGTYWVRDETYATCYLIWCAEMFDILSRKITPSSRPKLQTKIKALLHSHSEAQFIQNLAEFEVGCAFAERISPLMLEPLIQEDEISGTAKRPKSPDFAFHLPNERIYLEVTVFYVGILDKWQKGVDDILTIIEKRLMKQQRSLLLRIQMPLADFNAQQITEQTWRKIREADSGRMIVIDKGTIEWSAYPVTGVSMNASSPSINHSGNPPTLTAAGNWEIAFRVMKLEDHPSGFIEISPFGISHTPNYIVDQAIVKEPHLVALSEKDVHAANELVVKSLQNKLKDKRKQFKDEEPYFLVIKPGNYRLINEGLREMIKQRIWSKPDFGWITGMVLFTSRSGFNLSSREPQLTVLPNPNARCPVSDSFKQVVDGKAQFHVVN
jgi:hypothetical protein